MALKLFRSTGYSSILAPGETHVAKHPGWLVLAVSLWAGFVCNVLLWRAVAALPGTAAALPHAVALGAFIAAACALFLSVLGWRKTLKPAATLVLFLAGLSACAIWSQGLPLTSIAEVHLPRMFMPSWASLLRWQVALLLVVLAVLPTVWAWNTPVRRLPGPAQLSANLQGMLAAALMLGIFGFLLFGGAV